MKRTVLRLFASNRKVTRLFIASIGLSFFLLPFAAYWSQKAAGTISGRVFQDYNSNGTYDTAGSTALPAIDAGVQGVTVTVYDSAGVARGTANTGSSGTYSISATGTGPYRVEFTNLPANYQPSARSTDSVSGGTTTNSGSTVQFVNDGNTSNVNLAINVSEDYCQNNPNLCTAIFRPGNQSGSRSTSISVPYTSPSANTNLANESQTGTVYGTAYQRSTRTIFQSAYMKRHAGFGSLGTGGIYKIDMSSGSPVFSTYINLQTIGLNTGTDPRVTAGYTLPNNGSTPHWDYAAYTEVGKRAIGDLDYDEGRNTLWFINLNDRRLHGIQNVNPNVTPVNSDLVRDTSNNLGFNVNTNTPITCTNGVLRPFGIEVHRGLIYVGAVCSGENAGATAANLVAYVLSMNPDNPSAGFTQVVSFPLNYSRTKVNFGGDAPWTTWRGSDSTRTIAGGERPQPIVSDLEFDKDGSLIMAIKDRWGDQYAANQYRPDTAQSNTTLVTEVYGFGDILRFCNNSGTLANPGTAGCANNPRPSSENGANSGGSQGPGNGEFYVGDWGPDDPDNFGETAHGALAILSGSNRVVSTSLDPAAYYSNGLKWLNNTDGSRISTYNTFTGSSNNTTNDFNKGNGLGDLELLCDRAPIEIGNRVWRDTDNDGVQDPDENGIASVTVRLYNSSNTLIATAVTDSNGEYYFTSGSTADGNTTDNIGIVNGQITPNTNYQIRFDLAANYSGGGPLNGLLLTYSNQTSQLGFDEGSDSDASLVTNPTNSPGGTYPVIEITTGPAGENNHNLDVGFASSSTYSIGNRVWFDTNDDGQINSGEVGISGVSVSLFLDANTDGTPDTPASPVGTQNTDANGYYRFDNLAANNYVVRVNPSNFANGGVLGGYANTSGSNNTDLDSTSVAGQNGENGINPSGAANILQTNGILSGSIAIGAPGEPINESDVQAGGQGAIDPAANMTVDFGFYRACISGIIWNDNGAGTPANNNNGFLNNGESPIPSVQVQLYNSSNTEILVGPDGILGTSDDAVNGMVTNSGGNYSFCNLSSGQYRVVVTTPGGSSSTPTSNNPDDNVDSDDNGFPGSAPFAGKTASGLVTVTPGHAGPLNNKTVTNSTATTSDPTIDFGFVLPPTAIQLEKFNVTTDGGEVSLTWTTGGESGNLGFNIYRETNGRRERINSSPIAGSALRWNANLVVGGDNYSWVDKESKPGSVYYLEDIDIEGTRTSYGPVAPMFKISTDKFERNAVLVSDLAGATNSLSQKEFAGFSEMSLNSLNPSRQFDIAAREGVKISVNHEGWYRVSAEQLSANGFDINSNRANWQLFVGGEEVAMRITVDGSIEFYGYGTDTLATDRQVYYLVNGQTGGLRLTEVKSGRAGENPLPSFTSTVQNKNRSIYVSSILNGEAENWFGAIINPNGQTVETLNLTNIDTVSPARLRVKLQGLTVTAHSVNVRFNDLDLGQVSFNGMENREFDFDIPASSLNEGVNSVRLQSVGATNDFSLVDTVSLSYSRLYKAVNNRLRFTVPAGQSVRVSGFTTGKIAVNEIQNGAVGVRAAVYVTESNGEASFELGAVGRNREFLAVGLLQSEHAAAVEPNHPSRWNAADNEAEMIVIAPAVFQNQAAQLAEMRQRQNLAAKVVLAEDIADEFGYGILTVDAIKAFLQNASANWSVKPNYVVLFGDSSYDLRNYLGQTNRNLIPTKLIDTVFMETSSDSWMADFDNDGIENIAIGRLPASNQTEADVLVAKLVRYDQQPDRAERMSLLVSDRFFESYSQILQNDLPQNIGTFRIDRSSLTDTEMNTQIMAKLNDNPMVAVYTGHGSPGVWASTSVFSLTNVANLTNSQLSFYLLTTCLNGYTHNSNNDSLSEAAMKNPNGGAIAVWASSGTNFPDSQTAASRRAMNLIFNHQNEQMRIGDIVRQSKLATTDQDVRRNYIFLGDPTIFIK